MRYDSKKTRWAAAVLGLALLTALAIACGSQQQEAPAAQPTADVQAIIQQTLAAQQQPESMSAAEVAKAVQDAMAAQPGVTQADVGSAIADALAQQSPD